MPKTETLAAFIARVRARKRLSFQDVANASGGSISSNYIHNLEKGFPSKKLGGNKIVGLAKGLGESPIEVFCLAQGINAQSGEHMRQMLEEFSQLSKEDQKDLRPAIEMLQREIYERRSKTR